MPAEELARARALLLADLARGEEGAEGHARRLGWERAVLGRDDAAERYRARLERLDPSSLRAAAARLLRPEALALAVVEPPRAHAALDAESQRLRALLAAATAPAQVVAEKAARAAGRRPGAGDHPRRRAGRRAARSGRAVGGRRGRLGGRRPRRGCRLERRRRR